MTAETNTLWILHRDPAVRDALLRLLPGEGEIVTGSPADSSFVNGSIPLPAAILMGVSGDFELELEFAHRLRDVVAPAHWILVTPPEDLREVERLFDTLAGEVLAWPPSAVRLQERIRAAVRQRARPSLSQRSEREALTARFARWFPEAELPDLLRALDPGLAGVPILIQGEPGTGRSLLARYIHTFTTREDADFVAVSCAGVEHTGELLVQFSSLPKTSRRASILLEETQLLPPSVQHRVCDWIEFGLPNEAGLGLSPERLRWVVAAGPPSETVLLAPRLVQALAGLVLTLEPIRGRREAIEHFAKEAVRTWCESHPTSNRSLAPEALELLCGYPWPGNYRELDAVLTRSLASSGAQEIQAADLNFEAASAAPRAERGRPGPDHRSTDALAPSVLPGEKTWPRILHAAAEELESPLASIRALAELMPEYHTDADFREQFRDLVAGDLQHIERVVREVSGVADLSGPKLEPVDVASLIDSLIDAHHESIASRQIRVRKELDRDFPMAVGDLRLLEHALKGIVRRAIEDLPVGGNLFVTSRSHTDLQGSASQLRILLRCQSDPSQKEAADNGLPKQPAENRLEIVTAHAILTAMGGAFTFDASHERETVMIVDLPAPEIA